MKLIALKYILGKPNKAGLRWGTFSPRYTMSIKPIFWAGQRKQFPIISQESQIDKNAYFPGSDKHAADFQALKPAPENADM